MAFNFADLLTTIAAEVPDTEALIIGDRRQTYAELEERSCRLANFLLGAGLEVRAERADLAGHESGQSHVALYLYNGFEYLEGMFGAWKARAASPRCRGSRGTRTPASERRGSGTAACVP